MSAEMFALIIRGIVIVGTVLFAFTLLITGFYLVLREYRLIRSFKSLKEFIELTKEGGLEADLAKGTVSLSRTRPGLIMMTIGAILLIVCVLRPLEIASESHPTNGGPTWSTPKSPTSSGYDEWLSIIDDVASQPPQEQGQLLATVTPEAGIGRRVFFSLAGDTPAGIAEGIYGDTKYEPLVRAFNPGVSKHKSEIPPSTPILVWLIGRADQTPAFVVRKMIRIAGEDPKAIYTKVSPILLKVAEGLEEADDPNAYWLERNCDMGVFTLTDALKTLTGVGWSLQDFTPQEGDTPAIIARTEYGKREYYKYLLIPNAGNDAVTEALKKPDEEIEGRFFLLRAVGH